MGSLTAGGKSQQQSNCGTTTMGLQKRADLKLTGSGVTKSGGQGGEAPLTYTPNHINYKRPTQRSLMKEATTTHIVMQCSFGTTHSTASRKGNDTIFVFFSFARETDRLAQHWLSFHDIQLDGATLSRTAFPTA